MDVSGSINLTISNLTLGDLKRVVRGLKAAGLGTPTLYACGYLEDVPDEGGVFASYPGCKVTSVNATTVSLIVNGDESCEALVGTETSFRILI